MSDPTGQSSVNRLKYFSVIISGALLISCEEAHKTEEVASPKEMQAMIEKAVPKGMALDMAKVFMEGEGFVCEEVKGGIWKGRKGLNFLHCKREDGQMIKRRWEFALMHDGRTVSDLEEQLYAFVLSTEDDAVLSDELLCIKANNLLQESDLDAQV